MEADSSTLFGEATADKTLAALTLNRQTCLDRTMAYDTRNVTGTKTDSPRVEQPKHKVGAPLPLSVGS